METKKNKTKTLGHGGNPSHSQLSQSARHNKRLVRLPPPLYHPVQQLLQQLLLLQQQPCGAAAQSKKDD